VEVADKLRGTFKQHEYGSVMLPLLVLRRMDAVLTPTKAQVLENAKSLPDDAPGRRDPQARRRAPVLQHLAVIVREPARR
jgi:type I restriction-modification system DNA methylase subunit